MNALMISQETLDDQLASCKDGETGDFTIKGGTLTMVPGVGAVVSGETITKKGYENDADETDEQDAEWARTEPKPKKGKMSPAAMAVVGRKGSY